MNSKPTVYWILQENHVTPHNLNFLKFFKERVEDVAIKYLIPNIWDKTLEMAKELDPIPFASRVHELQSYDWYCRKRDSIFDLKFPDGLTAWQTLILDDLNAGNANPVAPEFPEDPNLQFILMQLPVPLGSLENEERIFNAVCHWAQLKKKPVIGYEQLPFDTRWTLPPALVDGVITNNKASYDYLADPKTGLNKRIWQLPKYEGMCFSVTSTDFWKSALGMTYQHKQEYNITNDVLVLYIPHNVALTQELKVVINYLSQMDEKIHLMLSIGKDQVRGTHSHQEIIETLNKDDLPKFHSFSFHDVNHLWAMKLADAVISCSSIHATQMASENGIPSIIIDETVRPERKDYLIKTKNIQDLHPFLQMVRNNHNRETPLIDIFVEIINVTRNLNSSS